MEGVISPRLRNQLAFIREIDALKERWRRTVLLDGTRVENDAEHSWEIALMAAVLGEYASPGTNLSRVIAMLLVHDLVEIDAGDTFVYDTAASTDQRMREEIAAERIFGLLPGDQATEFRSLWDEFEERATPEARFARAMDRLQPLLHNFQTEGMTWREHKITASQVKGMMGMISGSSSKIGDMRHRCHHAPYAC